MALTDIIQRIQADAAAEAAQIRADAQTRAEAIRRSATEAAEAERAAAVTRAQAEADREASRVVVNARLAARDEALAERRRVLDEVLEATANRLSALPDAQYARLLGGLIAEVIRGGETVSFGTADADRGDAIMAEVNAQANRAVSASPVPAPFERGALVTGERTRVDLSLQAIVAEQRSEIEAAAAAVLFDEGA